MKITSTIIPLLLLLSVALTLDETSSEESGPKFQYAWGAMKTYKQTLPEQVGEGRFNETKEFEFKFDGLRSTYNMKIDGFLGASTNPCQVVGRKVNLEIEVLNSHQSIQDKDNYVAMHSFNNFLATVSQNYQLQLLNISNKDNGEGVNLQLLKNIDLKTRYFNSTILSGNPVIISSLSGKNLHIIYPQTMMSIAIPENLSQSSTIQIIVHTQFIPKTQFFSAVYLKGYLFLAAGEQGLDVYQIKDDNIEKLQFIKSQKQLNFGVAQESYISDVAIDTSLNLYIADKNNGIIIQRIDRNDFSKSKVIHVITLLKKAEKLGVRGDHTLVVAGTETIKQINLSTNNFAYVIFQSGEKQFFTQEVFYDIESNDYFINREFIDKQMRWIDIQMGNLFTFIQGVGAHRILYQGVNKELIPQEDNHSDFKQGIAIQEMDLYEVKQVQSIQLDESLFIGISDENIVSIVLNEIPPQLICKADDGEQIRDNAMQVVFYSTDCSLAQYHNPITHNLWQNCETTFPFTFYVHEVLVDSSNLLQVGLIGVIIVLSLVILIMFILYYLNQNRAQIEYLQELLSTTKFQKYSHIKNISLGSESEKVELDFPQMLRSGSKVPLQPSLPYADLEEEGENQGEGQIQSAVEIQNQQGEEDEQEGENKL